MTPSFFQRHPARCLTVVAGAVLCALTLGACTSDQMLQSLGRGIQGSVPQPPTISLLLRPGQVSRYHASLEMHSTTRPDAVLVAGASELDTEKTMRLEFDAQVTVDRMEGNIAHVKFHMSRIKGSLAAKEGGKEGRNDAPEMDGFSLPLQIDVRTAAISDFSTALDPVIAGPGQTFEPVRRELVRLIRAHFGHLPQGGTARLGESWQVSDAVISPFGADLPLGVTYTFTNQDQRGNARVALITGTGTQPLRFRVEVQDTELNVAGQISDNRQVEVDMGSGLTRMAKAENTLQVTLSAPGGQGGTLRVVSSVRGNIEPLQ